MDMTLWKSIMEAKFQLILCFQVSFSDASIGKSSVEQLL